MKLVINTCYGGFGLSAAAMEMYHSRKGLPPPKNFLDFDIQRDDPDLVYVVETLGKDASNAFSKLKVVEIPDGVSWEISEYDGREHVAESHRVWS